MKWIERKAVTKPNKGDSVLDKIAKIRGIKDVNRFLSPTKEELNDPYLLKNIEDASNKIIRAITNNDRIVLSYDADADGLTATTIMMRYLKNYTDNVDYIYSERNDGHGITEQLELNRLNPEKDKERIERSIRNIEKVSNCDLLILIDSSSNDVDTCKHIVESFGCDIIILDHHAIEEDNPYVLMVNPQQPEDEYPNKFISGAGVVFKTIQVMEDTLGKVDVWQYIDLVAVGMYADVMRVDVLENRYLIMHGLRNMKNTGLLRILKGAKANPLKLNGDSIGFSIAPLLNGVARMDNIKLAIDILLEDDDKKCMKLRLQMQKLNELRKAKQSNIFDKYCENIDNSKKILIVMDEQSSKGFNGLVAQQLSDTYKRPVIVGRLHKGTLSGSFRSFGGFDLKQFLIDSTLAEEAMGHPQAGGITVKEENIQSLIDYIENNLPELNNKEQFVIYDLEMHVSEILDYLQDVQRFNLLTGNGFPKIIVKVNGVTVNEVNCIGETRQTVKISTFDDMELIKFRVNENYASDIGIYDEIDVVGQLNLNEWYNFGTKQMVRIPQVMIDDYVVSE